MSRYTSTSAYPTNIYSLNNTLTRVFLNPHKLRTRRHAPPRGINRLISIYYCCPLPPAPRAPQPPTSAARRPAPGALRPGSACPDLFASSLAQRAPHVCTRLYHTVHTHKLIKQVKIVHLTFATFEQIR